MDDALHRQLYSLVHGRRIASLGTLDKGEPFVSMVPYALHGERASPIIHVSALSAHTRHMLVHPRVSFMVTESENAPDGDGQPIAPQALPRVTVQGDASRLDPEGDDYTAAKRAYLARFPDAALMFEQIGRAHV